MGGMGVIVLGPREGDGSDERKTKLSFQRLGVVEFDADNDAVDDHSHEVDEGFYVLKGNMTFRADGASHEAPAGSFVFIPAGTVHGFSHDSPARYLVLSSPGGLEKYFAEIEEAEARDADDTELSAIARRHGTRFTG